MRLTKLMLLASPLALATVAVTVGLANAATPAAVPADARQSHVTGVGLHNTYEKAAFPYLADALDSGTSLIELDVWVYAVGAKWRVNHEIPTALGDNGQRNNCTNGGLRSGGGNQGLDRCLENLKLWHDQHPGHRPITVKIEFKAGLNVQAGASATDLDNLIKAKMGDTVFTPGQLLGDYPTLDAAAKADNWPTRAQMAGKFIFEIIPGTFERGNPLDKLKTDVEYGRHLRDNPKTAQAFPAVLDAQAGDPRTRFSETSIRPWFVFFDGTAASYVTGGIDPKWYDDNHYYLVMTSAHDIPPSLGGRAPDAVAAAQRVADLAKAHASIVSTDWYGLPSVLGTELPRG
jgi:hypothetical protein